VVGDSARKGPRKKRGQIRLGKGSIRGRGKGSQRVFDQNSSARTNERGNIFKSERVAVAHLKRRGRSNLGRREGKATCSFVQQRIPESQLQKLNRGPWLCLACLQTYILYSGGEP